MKPPAKQPLAHCILSAALLIIAAAGMISTATAEIVSLRDFAGGYDDGSYPWGSLTPSGSTLYGMTRKGGSNNCGVIFKMDTAGNNYTNLHKFVGGYYDGRQPFGDLTLSGSTLYGMTYYGGISDFGVIFKMEIDGSNYTNLHKFANGNDDGKWPYGFLTLSGSTLYGMTSGGGDGNHGFIFKIETDGSDYTTLHEFVAGSNDGSRPKGSLTLFGSTLYGMTRQGGSNSCGVIFKMNIDGSSYTNLHKFVGGNDDGQNPEGSLTLSGSTLYGMTYSGGINNYGVIFRMDTDGSSYTNLHKFTGVPNDGSRPLGSLSLFGGTLYGMTYNGGINNDGVIFRMDTNGSYYAKLHDFGGGSGDGSQPYYGALVEVDGNYYGMTRSGGSNDSGVVFMLVPEPTVFVFALIAVGVLRIVRSV